MLHPRGNSADKRRINRAKLVPGLEPKQERASPWRDTPMLRLLCVVIFATVISSCADCYGRIRLTGTVFMTLASSSAGSVFLVEDEAMIRMMVVDMLEELGFSVAAETGEINEAIKLAGSTEFDIAILDVNVNGKVISPVADLLKARNRPFIFATGYGTQGVPEHYRDRPALQKPFQIESLKDALDSTLRGAAA
jgi:CheY-like chemotaxis protein